MFLRILCFILLLFPASAGAWELAVYTEELPPLNFQDKNKNQADGFSVRIVEELVSRTGIRIKKGKIRASVPIVPIVADHRF